MRVRVDELDDWQGQPSFRIETPAATYVYHRRGAGFASIIDPSGADWISYRPGGGSAGEYRGIPNIIHPEGGFHPGAETCSSRLVEAQRQRVVIASESLDGEWACTWTIGPDRAVMDLERIGHPYWILCEGAPGGRYEETQAYTVDAADRRDPAFATWERRLPDPRWVYFGMTAPPYVLYLVDHTPRSPDVLDSYWSMEKNMTVFGFGRGPDSSEADSGGPEDGIACSDEQAPRRPVQVNLLAESSLCARSSPSCRLSLSASSLGHAGSALGWQPGASKPSSCDVVSRAQCVCWELRPRIVWNGSGPVPEWTNSLSKRLERDQRRRAGQRGGPYFAAHSAPACSSPLSDSSGSAASHRIRRAMQSIPTSARRRDKHRPAPRRPLRPQEGPPCEESATLLHPLLRRKAPARRGAFESLLGAVFARARNRGLIDERPEAAIDATGLETRQASPYYLTRSGRLKRRKDWPKLTVVCHSATHLVAGEVVSRGPSNDSPQFPQAMRQTARNLRFDRLLADAAYHAEHNQALCRRELGIRSTVIPINERRANAPPSGPYRGQMARRFHRRLCGQGWQVESAISQNKRVLGPAVRAAGDDAQARKCLVRVLTHNLMIL